MKVNGTKVTSDNIIWVGAEFSTEFDSTVEWIRKGIPRIYDNEPKWSNGTFRFTITERQLAGSKKAIDVAVGNFASNFVNCTIETDSTDFKTYPYKFIGALQDYSAEYIGDETAVVTLQIKGYKQADNLTSEGDTIQNHIKRFHFPTAGTLSGGLIASLMYKITDPTKSITLAAEFNHWSASGAVALSEMIRWTFPANTLPTGNIEIVLNTITGESTWEDIEGGGVYNAMPYLGSSILPKTHPVNGRYDVSVWGSTQTNGEFKNANLEIESRWL